MGRGSDKNQLGFDSIGDLLKGYETEEDKYISKEFQKYGYDLAEELGDLDHKSLYIKLAKEEERGFLETAKNYVKDAKDVENKGALFMWKLSQLKKAKKVNTQEES
jgi:hypothetical protein